MINKKEWNESDSLEEFLNWFLTKCPSIGRVPFNNPITYTKFGEQACTLITWYRSGPFQVQLVIMDPNTIVPEHTHPNMDSFEVYSGGKINFYLNGNLETEDWNQVSLKENEPSLNRGNFIRVKPYDLHGGVFGPEGSVFFSVQKWINGVEPKNATEDWNGVVYSQQHEDMISTGKSVLVNEYSIKDAYSSDILKNYES
jgi:hypothetical protein